MQSLLKRYARFFPFLSWFPLTPDSVKVNFLAGLTVALVLIPQSMAYAQLAGLPAYYGLYAAFLPVAIGAMWGSSNQLATGPVAVVSLLTASALSGMQKALEVLRECMSTGEAADRPDLLVDIETITALMGYGRVSALENELLSEDALARRYRGDVRDYVVSPKSSG